MSSDWPNTHAVYLTDGPLAGHTVEAPARVGPPAHLFVNATDPTQTLPGPNPPTDGTGWLLYADTGYNPGRARWEFTYTGQA